MNQKVWPKDYSDEEIISAIERGALQESGFVGGKESGLAEILKRGKNSSEKSSKRNFWISVVILIISIISLFVSSTKVVWDFLKNF